MFQLQSKTGLGVRSSAAAAGSVTLDRRLALSELASPYYEMEI